MKRVLKSIALISVSSIITLFVVELLLHAIPGVLPIEVRQAFNNKGAPHPEVGNLPEPGSTGVIVTRDFESPFEVDEKGFRNEGGWPEQVDIIAIGDSLVFGYGVDVDLAWPQLLAEKTGSSVLNLGLIGASPQHYRRIHEAFSRPFAPDVVVVGFFARNDFWDANKFAAWQKSGVGGNYLEWRAFGMPTAEQYANPFYRAMFELRKRSYVLSLLKFGRDAFRRDSTGQAEIVQTASGSELYLFEKDFRTKTELAGPRNDTFKLVVDELRVMRDAALSDGSRLVLLLQPAKEEVYSPNGTNELPDATLALRAVLDELGIEYIDAVPVYREMAEAGPALFFSIDGHPNAEGYALLADLVAEYLNVAVDQTTELTLNNQESIE
ncbi:MAG: SGNH/GDSL hydrolase family protein [Woeseiaceae bacterium]